MGIIIENYNDLTFLERRKAYLQWLSRVLPNKIERFPNNSKYLPKGTMNVNYITILELSEMYQKSTEKVEYISPFEIYDPYCFKKEWNTRKIFPSELRIEFDGDNLEMNLPHFYKACIELIKMEKHFVTFYASGQRCPHIIIYDAFDFNDSHTSEERNYARYLFCQKMLSFTAFELLDKQLLAEGHPVCLEFSKHWRYGSMFKLMFEHLPSEENKVMKKIEEVQICLDR